MNSTKPKFKSVIEHVLSFITILRLTCQEGLHNSVLSSHFPLLTQFFLRHFRYKLIRNRDNSEREECLVSARRLKGIISLWSTTCAYQRAKHHLTETQSTFVWRKGKFTHAHSIFIDWLYNRGHFWRSKSVSSNFFLEILEFKTSNYTCVLHLWNERMNCSFFCADIFFYCMTWKQSPSVENI